MSAHAVTDFPLVPAPESPTARTTVPVVARSPGIATGALLTLGHPDASYVEYQRDLEPQWLAAIAAAPD